MDQSFRFEPHSVLLKKEKGKVHGYRPKIHRLQPTADSQSTYKRVKKAFLQSMDAAKIPNAKSLFLDYLEVNHPLLITRYNNDYRKTRQPFITIQTQLQQAPVENNLDAHRSLQLQAETIEICKDNLQIMQDKEEKLQAVINNYEKEKAISQRTRGLIKHNEKLNQKLREEMAKLTELGLFVEQKIQQNKNQKERLVALELEREERELQCSTSEAALNQKKEQIITRGKRLISRENNLKKREETYINDKERLSRRNLDLEKNRRKYETDKQGLRQKQTQLRLDNKGIEKLLNDGQKQRNYPSNEQDVLVKTKELDELENEIKEREENLKRKEKELALKEKEILEHHHSLQTLSSKNSEEVQHLKILGDSLVQFHKEVFEGTELTVKRCKQILENVEMIRVGEMLKNNKTQEAMDAVKG